MSVVKSQDPQDDLDYKADFRAHCVRYREPNTQYSSSTFVEPMQATGFSYEATVAGRTAAIEPKWPRVVGATVKDGSLTWTCRAPTADSLQRQLTGATWTAADLTVGTPVNDSVSSTAYISGGKLGQSYEVVAVGAFNDGSDKAIAFTLSVER